MPEYKNTPALSSSLPGERQSNIELLRIIAAVGVIVLHYNNKGIGGAFGAVAHGSTGALLLYFLEALFIGSVDLFMMIMGRFQAVKKEVNVSKIVTLLMQVSIVHLVNHLIRIAINGKAFSPVRFGIRALPSNYFIITYCIVLALSPYVNKLLEHIKNKRQFVFLLLLLFSIIPAGLTLLHSGAGISIKTLHPISKVGAGNGYTVVNYMLMYIIGAASKDLKLKRKTCIAGLAACVIPLFIFEVCAKYSLPHPSHFHSYASPLVIGLAFFSLMLFSTFNIGVKKWINTLASGTLMVYLTHKYFLPLFNIKEAVSKGGWSLLTNLIITCAACFLIGWALSKIYGFIMKPFLKKITIAMSKCRISA